MPFGISAGTAALIGGGLSAAGGVASGLIQSGTAGKAAGTAEHNLQMILPQMQTGYNQTVGAYQPYQAGGQLSTSDMSDLLGLNGQDAANAAMAKFQSSPGYQFQLQQGLRATDAGAAASGMLRSGATLKAEQTFGQGLAAQDFGNYYNRLSGLAGQGLTAAGGVASANQNLVANEEGNATSQNAVGIGAANAQNSILGNTASGLGTTVNSLMSNPNVISQLNSWFGGSGSTFSPSSTGTYGGQTSYTGPTNTSAPTTYNF